MCSFCPWRHTRHLWSPLHLLCICESLSSQQALAWGTRQPAGDSVVSQANTGPGWQTSHLCVCMGTSGNPRLAGPSVCLAVWLWAYTHTLLCVPVLSWHQNFYSYTGTALLYKNYSQYQSKQTKCHIKTTALFYGLLNEINMLGCQPN